MIFHLQCGLYQVSSIPGASPQNIALQDRKVGNIFLKFVCSAIYITDHDT